MKTNMRGEIEMKATVKSKNENNVTKQKKIRGIMPIKLFVSISTLIITMLGIILFVQAVTGTAPSGAALTQFDTIIKFIAGWIAKLGLIVGFIGAVQFGFAFRNDDADGKTKGLRTLISGFIVFAITQTLEMFGVV